MSCQGATHTPAKMSTPLEDDVKKPELKIKVKLLGNVREYEAGQVYEVGAAEAASLLTLGYAVQVNDTPVVQAKE